MVSVAIKVRNAESTLSETLDSLLAQTYEALEVIAVDDASTDSTPAILRAYQERYPKKVRPIFLDAHGGPTVGSNTALEACEGELIAWVDGDDLCVPEKISVQVQAMLDIPEAALSYHSMEIFEEGTGDTLSISNQNEPPLRTVEELVASGNFIITSSLMHWREVTPSPAFRSSLPVLSDWLFAIEMALKGPILNVGSALGRYRRRTDQITAERSEKFGELITDYMTTLDIVAHEHPHLRRSVRKGRASVAYWEAWRNSVTVGPGRRVARSARKVLRFQPTHGGAWKMLFGSLPGVPLARRLIRGIGRRLAR